VKFWLQKESEDHVEGKPVDDERVVEVKEDDAFATGWQIELEEVNELTDFIMRNGGGCTIEVSDNETPLLILYDAL